MLFNNKFEYISLEKIINICTRNRRKTFKKKGLHKNFYLSMSLFYISNTAAIFTQFEHHSRELAQFLQVRVPRLAYAQDEQLLLLADLNLHYFWTLHVLLQHSGFQHLVEQQVFQHCVWAKALKATLLHFQVILKFELLKSFLL
jgi:hypothetical protein